MTKLGNVMLGTSGMRYVLTMSVALVVSSGAFAGDDGVWSISKSSGEVWVTTAGAEQASLKQDDTLKPGDFVRTGRNGRAAPLAFMRLRDETRLRRDWLLNYFLLHENSLINV